jgi:hypothetical protein
MNSENLGARIMQNEAPDQKIWALEDLKGKMVFLGDSRGFCGSLEWLEGFGAKESGFLRILGIFRGFLECL